MLRESAALAARDRHSGRHTSLRTHTRSRQVARHFPEARDYMDVYDLAGGLGRSAPRPRHPFVAREVDRIVDTGVRGGPLPFSDMFLASGVMPLAHYLRPASRRPRQRRRGWAGAVDAPSCAPAATPRAAATTMFGDETRRLLRPLDWLCLCDLRRRPGTGPGKRRSARSRWARKRTSSWSIRE